MLPMIIDTYKKELLYRKAHGNSLRKRYKEKLQFLLGTDPEDRLFLSLAETDDIINKLLRNENIFSENAEFSVMDECLMHCLSEVTGGDYYLLMDEGWRYCGAYIVRDFNLNMEFEFTKHQSDEIRLVGTDFSKEITIDYTESRNEDLCEFCVNKYALA
jgi:hypothetical protein